MTCRNPACGVQSRCLGSGAAACAGDPLCCCAMAAALAEGQGTVLSKQTPWQSDCGTGASPGLLEQEAWHETAEKVPARGAAPQPRPSGARGLQGPRGSPGWAGGSWQPCGQVRAALPPRAAPWAGWAPAARQRAPAALTGCHAGTVVSQAVIL